ncbi:MAG: metal-dependent hydrolase [Patescibacteria group bacterium]|nr:metal-dependent hydrolase [Patescibacteria group bacterium]
MFIAHLPAGYILTTTLQKKLKTNKYLLLGLIASILPDVDLFYFFLVDNRQYLHHGYWSHIPFYWLLIAVVTLIVAWLAKKKEYMFASVIFFSNIFLHLILDTIVGRIEWLYPFTNKAFYLFSVPNVYGFWVYNFAFHWTFLFEVGLIAWAGYILFKEREEG